MAELLYKIENLSKSVETLSGDLEILHNVSLTVNKGESIALLGASGSGKSTLLHIMGALDSPTKGTLLFENKDLTKFSEKEKAYFRNQELGFVFQFHHLLPEFTTLENVAMQAFIAGMSNKQALELAKENLVRVGLEHRLNHKVTTLSGGERQRAGIARALLLNPKVLLADEPTGNLDEKSGQNIIDLLLKIKDDKNIALVIVTHNNALTSLMEKNFELKSGEIHVL